MNEETYQGWSEPPEETVTTEEEPPEEAPVDEPDASVEETDEDTEEAEEVAPDPLDEFKKDGKLFGRYENEVEALKAFQSNDTERGRLAAEVGQLRQALAAQRAPATTENIDALSELIGQPPSLIAHSQDFWDYATRELKLQPPVDDEGYIDTDSVNPADLLYATQKLQEYVKDQQESRQAREVMEQHRQVAEAFEQQYYASHPELQTIAPLVEFVFSELYMSRQWTPEELDAALTAGVRERITGVAASVLGQRGGHAAAEARKVPPGATPQGNALGLSSSRLESSEDEMYRGWAPKAIVKEAKATRW